MQKNREIDHDKNLAAIIRDTFAGLNRATVAGYIRVGDNILATAATEGVATYLLCERMTKLLENCVSVGTLRNAVLLAKTYHGKQLRAQLEKMSPSLENLVNLSHSMYDGKRGSILADIRSGKQHWKKITTPGREASLARQKAFSKQVMEGCGADAGHDPNVIRIQLMEKGEINVEAIEDAFASIITRTSLELATKLFNQATMRIRK